MSKSFLSALIVATCAAAAQSAVVTMAPLTSFANGTNAGGATPGWLETSEGGLGAGGGVQTFLNTDTTQRGMAYNPATGNLYFVSRTGPLSVRVLNGLTGAETGTLNVTGVAGGAFAGNMIGATTDGVIYLANLATSANTLRVYRYANEGSAPVSSGALTHAFTRLGDTFDVTGTGSNSTLVVSGSGITGYATLTHDGTAFSAVNQVTPITGTASGDFRLGLTFGGDATTVMGTQSAGAANGFRLTTYAGSAGTLVDSSTLTSASERGMDYVVVNGVPLLATVDTATGNTRVYDMTDPNNPLLLTSGDLQASTAGNTNGTSQVKFGAINGDIANLYVLNSNNGIQAFQLTVIPEASSFLAVGAVGLVFAAVRRMRRK